MRNVDLKTGGIDGTYERIVQAIVGAIETVSEPTASDGPLDAPVELPPREQVTRAAKIYERAKQTVREANALLTDGPVAVALKEQAVREAKREEQRAKRRLKAARNFEAKAAAESSPAGRIFKTAANDLTKTRFDLRKFFNMVKVVQGNADGGQNDAPHPVDIAAAHASAVSKFTETRPLPPAMTPDNRFRKDWPQEKRKGAGNMMAKRVTWWEVWLPLFPASPRLLEWFQPCLPDCKQCQRFRADLAQHEHGNPAKPLPVWKPCVNTGKAHGPDGITASFCRFARNAIPALRFDERKLVCEVFAEVFNDWLAEGRPPDSGLFAHSYIKPIPKPSKSGAFDPSNPDNYRCIAVSNFLPNLFSIVLLGRMSHWAVVEGVVSDPQIGFLPGGACEAHIIALLQVIRMNALLDKFGAILFVDFTGAYDNVYLALLWEMLEHAGVPKVIVGFLRAWYDRRQYQVQAGKEQGPIFSATKGLHQGGPLSPLLWNIYLEPLLRRLSREAEGITINVSGSKVGADEAPRSLHHSGQAYADDVGAAVSARNRAELRVKSQTVLDIVQDWAEDFVVPVNPKPNKTEVMAFAPRLNRTVTKSLRSPSAGEDPAIYLQPLRMRDGAPVNFVTSYTYLGAPLDQLLDMTAFGEDKVRKLKQAFHAGLRGNKVLRHLSYKLKMQTLGVMCIQVIMYLINVVNLSKDTLEKIDRAIREIGRDIFNYPDNAPNIVLEMELPFYPAVALVAAQKYRALMTIRLMDRQGTPAAQVVAFQDACMNKPGTFVYDTQKEVNKHINDTAVQSAAWAAASQKDVRSSSQAVKRAVATADLFPTYRSLDYFSDARPAAKEVLAEVLLDAIAKAKCPPNRTAEEHVTALYLATVPLNSHPADERRWCEHAPSLSLLGPQGCNLLRHWDRKKEYVPAVLLMRAGCTALNYAPWRGSTTGPSHQIGAAALKFDMTAPQQCPLCKDPRYVESPYHFVVECSHETMVGAREERLASLRSRLPVFLSAVVEAAVNSGMNSRDEIHGLRDNLLTAAEECSGGRLQDFLVYRMMLVLPFPAFISEHHKSMGHIFDRAKVTDQFLSKPTNIIADWASTWVHKLALARLAALPRGYYD